MWAMHGRGRGEGMGEGSIAMPLPQELENGRKGPQSVMGGADHSYIYQAETLRAK